MLIALYENATPSFDRRVALALWHRGRRPVGFLLILLVVAGAVALVRVATIGRQTLGGRETRARGGSDSSDGGGGCGGCGGGGD